MFVVLCCSSELRAWLVGCNDVCMLFFSIRVAWSWAANNLVLLPP